MRGEVAYHCKKYRESSDFRIVIDGLIVSCGAKLNLHRRAESFCSFGVTPT